MYQSSSWRNQSSFSARNAKAISRFNSSTPNGEARSAVRNTVKRQSGLGKLLQEKEE